MYGTSISPEKNLSSIHEELKKAGPGLAVGWKCVAKQRTSGSRDKQWDVEYIPPNGFQPADGEKHSKYRSRVGVLRAHGVSSSSLNWTPSPEAASKKLPMSTPTDQSPEAVAKPRKKRGRRPRSRAQKSRRKSDDGPCDNEHAQQVYLIQPPSKPCRVSAPEPQTQESDPVPSKKKVGRPAKTASTDQPHRNRKPGWGKWQQFSEMYVAKPKPKSISTWRQLTMHRDKSEDQDKQAADSEDVWDSEGSQSEESQSDDSQSLDLQSHTVEQNLDTDQQQHMHPRIGTLKPKTRKLEHAGLQDSSSDEELDICGVNPGSPIAAHKMRKQR